MRIFMGSLPDGRSVTVVCYCAAGMAPPREHTDDACHAYVTPARAAS